MSSGAAVKTAYAKQTDPKVVPTTGWKVLPNISNGLSVANELLNSEMVSGGRIAKAGMIGDGTIEGDISAEFQYGTYDDLLAGGFFNNWITSEGSPDTLVISDIKQFFAFTKDFTDVRSSTDPSVTGIFHLFTGCIVNKIDIEVTVGGFVNITFGLMGMGYQYSKTLSFAPNPTAAPDAKSASSRSIGTILKDGVDIGICVESFKFSLDNQAEIQKCLGNNMYGGNILAMLAAITGSITLAYGAPSHDILVNQITGAILALEVPIIFTETDKYIIKLPQIQVSGSIPSPSGTELVTIDVEYTVVNTSPVIEKHHA